ncbi:heavy-metal-associated domain-containing protein [Rhodanobacter sp. UC4450_H17]
MNRASALQRPVSYRYRLENLHCAACEKRLRTAFAGDTRVSAVDVDLSARSVVLQALEPGLGQALLASLAAAGFTATPDARAADSDGDHGSDD